MKLGRRLVPLALLATALVPTAPAHGAFPGADGLIAYTAERGGQSDLCVMNPDGTEPRLLVGGDGNQLEPAWSPDGTKLAYVDDTAEARHILVRDFVTGETTDLGRGSHPAWSPNGERLAFSDGRIWVMDADGTDRTQIVDVGNRPAWSPLGDAIAFDDDYRDGVVDEGGIWLTAPDGSNQRRISGGEFATWAPDGTKLAANSGFWAASLFTMNADGSNEQTLVQGHPAEGPFFYESAWSPSGTTIAFTRISNEPTGYTSDIWAIDPDGSDARPLLATSAVAEKDPDWQPVPPTEIIVPDGEGCAFEPRVRGITMSLRRHLIARGLVSSPFPECAAGFVRIERRRLVPAGRWRHVTTIQTKADGSYRVRLQDRQGFYRALVRADGSCAHAVSSSRRHRH